MVRVKANRQPVLSNTWTLKGGFTRPLAKKKTGFPHQKTMSGGARKNRVGFPEHGSDRVTNFVGANRSNGRKKRIGYQKNKVGLGEEKSRRGTIPEIQEVARRKQHTEKGGQRKR